MQTLVAAGLTLLVAAASILQAQESAHSVNDGVFTDAQAERGRDAYQTSCEACHGDTLAGVDVAPSLTGGAFQGNWNGQSLGELVARARTTMPQNDPGSLSAATITDIVAFILKSNGYPSGRTELPRDAGLQRMIRFEMAKPAG
jgi:S-disulfanyl-L-cysteine oxidoreductase SoxD